jgi:hypothetical protein
LDKLSIDKLRL